MTPVLSLREDLALDPDAVLGLLSDPIAAQAGFRPTSCLATVLKRSHRRLIVRYDLEGGERTAAVVGKWYTTERGALVAQALSALRANGFAGREHDVPPLITYVPHVRALFTESVDGTLMREVLRTDPSIAKRAGSWLAAFHASSFVSPRSCGPAKQRRALARWSGEQPILSALASQLDEFLAEAQDPGLPVHYDFYHSQILVTPERTVVLDLDEAGMGDPAFDLAHFEAHLRLLALQWYGDPEAFEPAIQHFREGYRGKAGRLPEPAGAGGGLRGYAWFKLAFQALRRGAPEEEWRFAMAAAGESASTS